MKHQHEYSVFPFHFGKYGDQTVHYHACVGDNCQHVLVGPGRECEKAHKHKHMRLTVNGPVAVNP